MKARFAIALGCLSLGATLAAYGQKVESGKGLELPKGAAISVVVDLIDVANKAGLNLNNIQARVELQLRRNGIIVQQNDDFPYFIYVNVAVLDRFYSISVAFYRFVTFKVDDRFFLNKAATYNKFSTGTFSDSEFIMQSVLNHIDILSNEILKAAQ